jgi:hypothetical protein
MSRIQGDRDDVLARLDEIKELLSKAEFWEYCNQQYARKKRRPYVIAALITVLILFVASW